MQYWNVASWINIEKAAYEYDANNNQTSSLIQSWNGNWVNDHQYAYAYDANNNQTFELSQRWESASWVNEHQDTYEYDAINNQVLSLSQVWIGTSWVNNSRTFYYYELISAVSNIDQLDFHFNAFPNPSKGNFIIDLGKNDVQDGHVYIYNSIGKLVHSQAILYGSNIISIELAGFLDGTYFL